MKKILVIDDDELILMTFRNLLKKEGFNVVEAQNGNLGIELYKSENPDLVVTDLHDDTGECCPVCQRGHV